LQFGLCGLTAQTLSGSSAETHEQIELLLDACRVAEESGLASIWVTEHHFSDDGYLPSPFAMLAAVARETSEVRLSSNVAIGALHHPIRLAEDAALVDHLSAGRLMVGLGLGYRDVEFRAFGVERSQRARRLEDCVTVLRSAWAGANVQSGGGVKVTPLPYQPGGPPLLLGALAEVGVRRAARIADGWIAPSFAQPRHLRKRLDWLREEGAFERPFVVALTLNGFVAPRHAWETVEPGALHVATQYRRWMTDSGDVPSLRPRAEDVEPSQDRPPQFIAGTPDDCADQLRPWRDAVADLPSTATVHLNLRMTFPGVARTDQLESIRLFGTEVAPRMQI
jgi:alkanesulfonate monooxygenase SsuD/methylene tetrahydromethanopterin reductase-like flavin-dependent oxidoreductase (luciferase family)